jgi:hypothetical protein
MRNKSRGVNLMSRFFENNFFSHFYEIKVLNSWKVCDYKRVYKINEFNAHFQLKLLVPCYQDYFLCVLSESFANLLVLITSRE